jgi:hypothetical protein
MSNPLVLPIHPLRIHPVQLPHASRQIALRRFHDQVIVIGHLAPAMTHPVEPFANLTQQLQPGQPIFIAKENGLPPITARGDVVQTSGKFNSEWARHKPSLAQKCLISRPDPVILS